MLRVWQPQAARGLSSVDVGLLCVSFWPLHAAGGPASPHAGGAGERPGSTGQLLGALVALSPPGAVSGTWQWHSQDLGEGGKGDTWLPAMEQLRAVLAGVASLHPPSTLEVADRCYLPILQMMKLKFREDCAVGHTAGQCPSDNCRGSACRRAARWTDCHPG